MPSRKRFQKDSEAEHFGAAGDLGFGIRVHAVEVGVEVGGAVGGVDPEETSRNCDFQVFVVGSGEVVAFDLELEAVAAGGAQALVIESITGSCGTGHRVVGDGEGASGDGTCAVFTEGGLDQVTGILVVGANGVVVGLNDAVVGVLVEVPVMLSLVAIANRNRRLFPA